MFGGCCAAETKEGEAPEEDSPYTKPRFLNLIRTNFKLACKRRWTPFMREQMTHEFLATSE
jgi:hypothetical protein